MPKNLDPLKTGLKQSHIDKISAILRSHANIQKVVLYGSRAKGDFRPGSDIDLCLFGDHLDSSVILSLDSQFDDLLLPYTFDISIYDKIDNPEFKDHIDRVGLIFYQNT